MANAKKLYNEIQRKKTGIGIIGLGYVGLPLALTVEKKGFEVLGFDVDKRKIDLLNAGRSYIAHIPPKRIKNAAKFSATDDFSRLSECGVIIICVPTPTTPANRPDLSFIIGTGRTISKHLRAGQLIVLESTTYPTTTRDVLKPLLDRKGLVCGRDYFLAFSPEREDPGNKKYDTESITKVVGGINAPSTRLASLFYSKVVRKVQVVPSAEIAESTKMLENTFRAVNIALVNELKMLFDRMGIDVWEVIKASKTKPFGFMPFYPGPGWGGHCIPLDPFYLSYIGEKYGFKTKFVELAGKINVHMPRYVSGKVAAALRKLGKSLKGSKILILGAAYKKDIGDPRESPFFEIVKVLERKGCRVSYNDPYIPVLPKMRKYSLSKKSVPLSPSNIRKYDCVLIVTDHSKYDYRLVFRNAKMVVDTRNRVEYDPEKVIKA
ncbi:MAG: nucleotide sugar dehydrogenase [Endomicrobiales bacterium]|nr:nucleotide sugar dehydrogenase [Endomicrobiales bacterium]